MNAEKDFVVEKDFNKSFYVLATATQLFFSLSVPGKARFVLTHFANYLNILTAWGSITWMIKINGVGVYPYDTLKDQYGYAAEPRPIAPVEVNGGDLFTIEAKNDFSATVGIGVAFRYHIKKETE